ncbi:Atxe2 family lasso peptide isopeptidase [Sphingopyxis macrogoltabida]|uniref:Peptidase S9 prolyl oligopeptidase catalytic domain-containing protein n=1 Tax=Sphingopyxis macrogoltabida TaxID=33050 RepID=A0AAC9AZP7_SPHMC|nr:Atxe2 family lasso peptide isopeptidase [Sphingopyxis macrogoltabida]ALJ16610.1 hypothetical protein LH19_27805 [Sphingopyxis macrogoltabida]AMU92838.1 hypothetical protein ATM17_31780 [Sphingopyxis macrogoltabida]
MKQLSRAWTQLALCLLASISVATDRVGATPVQADTPLICRGIVPIPRAASEKRAVRPDDLIGLRDFGSSAVSETFAPGFAMSPDGTKLAVQLRRADPAANDYCQAVLLFDLNSPTAPPVLLDAGGEYIREVLDVYGLKRFPRGMAAALTPKWSYDAGWLAFLRREQGETRLYVLSPATGQSRSFSKAGADVRDFTWNPREAILSVDFVSHGSPEQERFRAEGLSGYRYDARFWMLATTEPFEEQALEIERYRVDLSDGLHWQDAPLKRLPADAAGAVTASDEAEIVTDPLPVGAYRSRVRATVKGKPVPCEEEACTDVSAAWMEAASHRVVYLRRQGYAGAATGIYVWQPGVRPPRQIAETEDAFTGCQLAAQLICGRETSLRPRDVIEIDLESGETRPLANLNPEWDALMPGPVTRLRWVNRFGLEGIGDLVLPPGAQSRAPLPLVIVQYNTRGFLRGGVGDEYPIQAIGAEGFAVLSISRPLDYGVAMARARKLVSPEKIVELRLDRASAHDSLLQGIAEAKRVAAIDGNRIAITGLSDGASSATYALINSRVFSLALLSTCCEDPQITMTSIGPRYEQWMNDRGYYLPPGKDQRGWKRTSVAMNASKICARIVIQTADREARMALASFAALKQAGVVVDMFVFPDEYHNKWQPAHRDAVYRRSIAELKRWATEPMPKCGARR